MIAYCEGCGARIPDSAVIEVPTQRGVRKLCKQCAPAEAVERAKRSTRPQPTPQDPGRSVSRRIVVGETPARSRRSMTGKHSRPGGGSGSGVVVAILGLLLVGVALVLALVATQGDSPTGRSDDAEAAAEGENHTSRRTNTPAPKTTNEPKESPLARVRASLDELNADTSMDAEDRLEKLLALQDAVTRIGNRGSVSANELRKLADEIAGATIKHATRELRTGLPTDVVERARTILARYREVDVILPDELRRHESWTAVRADVEKAMKDAADKLYRDAYAFGLARLGQQTRSATKAEFDALTDGVRWVDRAAGQFGSTTLPGPDLQVVLARIDANQKNTPAAMARLARVVNEDPSFVPARELRGYLAAMTDDYATAAEDLDFTVTRDPETVRFAGINAANAYRMIGNPKRAAELCDLVLEVDPTAWRAHVNRAWAMQDLEGKEAGRTDWNKALEICDDPQWQARIRSELAKLDHD